MDLTDEQIAKLKEMLKILTVYFGITEEDLRYLPEAIKIVKGSQLPLKPITLDDKQKKEIEQKYQNAYTPEEYLNGFKNEVEEFYPNGREKAD